jgi:hypothetical protein
MLLQDSAAEDLRRDLAAVRALSTGATTGLAPGVSPGLGLWTALHLLACLVGVAWRRLHRRDE